MEKEEGVTMRTEGRLEDARTGRESKEREEKQYEGDWKISKRE